MATSFSKDKFINEVLYVIFIIIYLTTLTLYNMGHPISRARYFFLALMIVVRSNNNCYKST